MRNNIFVSPASAVIGALLVVVTGSCSKKNDPPQPVETGTYQGSVSTVDEFGNSLPDKSGVTVSVVGQTGYSTTTGADGRFTLQVPLGSQQVSFSKAGFGTYLTAATTMTGNGVTVSTPITLGQTSTTTVRFWRWQPQNNGSYYLLGCYLMPVSTSAQPRYHRVFFGRSADVSPTKYDVSLLFRDRRYDPNGITHDSCAHAPFAALTQQNIGKMYAVCYGDNPGADSYLDATTGLRVYPAISKAGSPAEVCSPIP